MSRVFLDTGYIIALEASDDQHHKEALEHWRQFSISPLPIVTTSFIMDDVVTFFNSRHRHDKAVEVGQYLLVSPSVNFINVDKTLFSEGRDFFQHHSDK